MIEKRRAELRAAPGRRIVGPAMVYGREARVMHPGGMQVTERFAAFAFSDYLLSGAATVLNLMHDSELRIATTPDGSLTLHDSPAELHLVATLPSGDAYDQALELVRDGSTAETSVEFRALRERVSGDRRTVLQATLPGISLVDRAAYGRAGAVETRARRRVVTATMPTKKRVACECSGRDCHYAEFDDGAFDNNLDDDERGPRDILAVYGDYTRPVASVNKGAVRMQKVAAGLGVAIDLPGVGGILTAILAAIATVGLYVRPYLDLERSEGERDGDTMHYTKAVVRAFTMTATDAIEGWDEAEMIEDEEQDEDVTPSRRRRLWL